MILSLLEQAGDREKFLAFGPEEDRQLCEEIREFLIASVSQTGGHLASNLGVVELTVALHHVFDPYRDRIVFDVGHQCYVHKLLTGRMEAFSTLRQLGGLSGFPKPQESDADPFISGHASNSVSAALGMARARTLTGDNYHVVAVLGDGALTGGLAYEGLNDAGQSREPLIVILNDNGMSIQPNVGAMSRFLKKQRLKPSYLGLKRLFHAVTAKIPGGRHLDNFVHRVKLWTKNALIGSNLFDQMGYHYMGPVDGHDIEKLTYLLQQAKAMACPVLLHVTTTKGRGYPFAEENPDEFHGVSGFDVASGETESSRRESFSDAFGRAACAMAEKDRRICAVTAAMETGTGLGTFADRFPRRFFDVGIAEGHAVTMACGLAKQGMVPITAIYSTFLQRAYDMLIHDAAIGNLHVVFAVDRAGLVGADGETHHGVFDVNYLRTVPNMTVLSPASTEELRSTLRFAVYETEGPAAVRYPRGGNGRYTECILHDAVLREGRDVTIAVYGIMTNEALSAAEILSREGVEAEIVKLWRLRPLDPSLIETSVRKTGYLLILEDCAASGCVGQELAAILASVPMCGMRLLNLGDGIVTHGTVPELYALCGIDGKSAAQAAKELIHREEGTT